MNVALSDQLEKQWPLEANPIQQAVLAYGRRTAALGALQGAHALKNLAARIRGLGNLSPALDQIVNDAEADANRLRQMLDKVYENE